MALTVYVARSPPQGCILQGTFAACSAGPGAHTLFPVLFTLDHRPWFSSPPEQLGGLRFRLHCSQHGDRTCPRHFAGGFPSSPGDSSKQAVPVRLELPPAWGAEKKLISLYPRRAFPRLITSARLAQSRLPVGMPACHECVPAGALNCKLAQASAQPQAEPVHPIKMLPNRRD